MAYGIDRVIKKTEVRGFWMLPMGLYTFDSKIPKIEKAIVSTVCLEGGHLESPLPGMLELEHGFETAVFLDGFSFFFVYRKHYKTRRSASAGHERVVSALLDKSLPLSIELAHWRAWDLAEVDKAA